MEGLTRWLAAGESTVYRCAPVTDSNALIGLQRSAGWRAVTAPKPKARATSKPVQDVTELPAR